MERAGAPPTWWAQSNGLAKLRRCLLDDELRARLVGVRASRCRLRRAGTAIDLECHGAGDRHSRERARRDLAGRRRVDDLFGLLDVEGLGSRRLAVVPLDRQRAERALRLRVRLEEG